MEVRSVEAIVRTLTAAGVEYLIVGGLAVNALNHRPLLPHRRFAKSRDCGEADDLS
jgi:hypothetical protein